MFLDVRLNQRRQWVDHRGRCGCRQLHIEFEAGGDVRAPPGDQLGGPDQEFFVKLILTQLIGRCGGNDLLSAIDHAKQLNGGSADVAIGNNAH